MYKIVETLVNNPLELASLLRESKRKINWINGSRGALWYCEDAFNIYRRSLNTIDAIHCIRKSLPRYNVINKKLFKCYRRFVQSFHSQACQPERKWLKGLGYLWKGFRSLTKGCNTKLAVLQGVLKCCRTSLCVFKCSILIVGLLFICFCDLLWRSIY